VEPDTRLRTLHLFAGAGGGILGDWLLDHVPVGAVELEEYPRKVLCNGSLTDAYLDSLFGTMSGPSGPTTPTLRDISNVCAESGPSSSLLADSHVRTYPAPAKASELEATVPACGQNSQELSVKYDPLSHSWKTHRCLWDEVLPESSVILPKWGMMHRGVLLERTMPERLTSGTEFGLWPTPHANCYTGPGSQNRDGGLNIQMAVKAQQWPTPTCNMVSGAPNHNSPAVQAGEHGINLAGAVLATFPTPKNRDWKGQSQRGIHAEQDALPNLDRGDGKPIGGSLNPSWVEWLMGWPHDEATRWGWTDLTPAPAGVMATMLDCWRREPAIPRVAVKIPNRVARLKAIGNGQVPACILLAWTLLPEAR